MTREGAKELLPIMQAFVDGKKIEYSNDSEDWIETETPTWDTDYVYRIKPEPKYRPFKNQEECWNEMQEHTNLGSLRRNETGACVNISAVFSHAIMFGDEEYGYKKAFECYTFTDGLPFGKREE